MMAAAASRAQAAAAVSPHGAAGSGSAFGSRRAAVATKADTRDEYGIIDDAGETHVLEHFELESGRRLYRVRTQENACFLGLRLPAARAHDFTAWVPAKLGHGTACRCTLRRVGAAQVPIRYRTWGSLNETKDNVLVICHALTGNGA
jgi:hypothetical protein